MNSDDQGFCTPNVFEPVRPLQLLCECQLSCQFVSVTVDSSSSALQLWKLELESTTPASVSGNDLQVAILRKLNPVWTSAADSLMFVDQALLGSLGAALTDIVSYHFVNPVTQCSLPHQAAPTSAHDLADAAAGSEGQDLFAANISSVSHDHPIKDLQIIFYCLLPRIIEQTIYIRNFQNTQLVAQVLNDLACNLPTSRMEQPGSGGGPQQAQISTSLVQLTNLLYPGILTQAILLSLVTVLRLQALSAAFHAWPPSGKGLTPAFITSCSRMPLSSDQVGAVLAPAVAVQPR